IIPAGYVHFAVGAERDAGRVDDVGEKRLALPFGRDLIDRNRDLLSPRPRQSGIDSPGIAIEDGIGDRVQVLRQLLPAGVLLAYAGGSVGVDSHMNFAAEQGIGRDRDYDLIQRGANPALFDTPT